MTAFIWDLDGTLIDSYKAIMEALEELYHHYALYFDRKWVADYVIQESVGQLLINLSRNEGLNLDELRMFFSREQEARDDSIVLLPYAKEILEWTQTAGIENFMYTHKGVTTQTVLDRLEISTFFEEILTGVSGFKRKPHPEGIYYLIEKYQLDAEDTYYIGDRKLDLEVAENAGIQSLNLSQKTGGINKKIRNLQDIKSHFLYD